MPVTPAHLVAAVPAWRRRRWWAAALAAGSIAPDLAHFVPSRRVDGSHLRDLTHTLVAVATVDVLLGLFLLFAGAALVWPTALAFAPDLVVERVDPAPVRPAGRRLLVRSASAVGIGALVHVGLDAVTHLTFGTRTVPVFEQMTGGQILQYSLSILGVAWLGWELVRFARRPPRAVIREVGVVGRTAVQLALVTIAVAAACWRLTEFASPRTGLRLYGTMAFQGGVRAVGVVAPVVVVGSAAWVWWQRRRVRSVPRGTRHADARPGPVGAAR